MSRSVQFVAWQLRSKWITSHQKPAAERMTSATYKGYVNDAMQRKQRPKTVPDGGAVGSLGREARDQSGVATFSRVQDTNLLTK